MEREMIPELVSRAPKLREKDIRAINETFRMFLFRRRKTQEIWTSCCGKHATLKGKELTAAERTVMDAKHQREKKNYWDDFKPQKTVCPYCGKEAEVKELGRMGDGRNLEEWGRGIVLRWHRGSLWAIVYNAKKGYRQKCDLKALPKVFVDGVYRFHMGTKPKVEWVFRPWWSEDWRYAEKGACTDGWKVSKIKGPFHPCAKYGNSYDTINVGEWEKSSFRWCEMGPWATIRYIAACTFWPRQVEMLEKAGLKELVDDLIYRGTKNAYIFSWNEMDPRKSFGLNGGELKEFLAVKGHSAALLRYYKKLNKAGIRVDFHETRMLELKLGVLAEKVITRLVRYKLPPVRWEKYIERERGDKKKIFAAEQWVDYVDAAKTIGLDMENPIVLCPKNLYKQHDEKTETVAKILAAQKSKEQGEKEERRFKALMKRYAYWDERYLIRPPMGINEIQREGEILKHCVAGYADRHVNGSVTILFLRDKRKPGKPLVTIEMRDNEIVQIHGYRNEMYACAENPKKQKPEKLYAGILEPWLEWLKAGSKRNKNWTPKKMKTKEAHVA